TLDGEDRKLDAGALVIADDREVLGLAGLRGGESSEVSPQTRELVIESATFFGPRVRRMGVALGLRTDASARHEKTLPLGLNDLGAARAAYLLAQTGATVHPPVIAGKAVETGTPIAVSLDLIQRTLGFRPAADEVGRALRGLGFAVERTSPD